jgi:hypothetical protein
MRVLPFAIAEASYSGFTSPYFFSAIVKVLIIDRLASSIMYVKLSILVKN